MRARTSSRWSGVRRSAAALLAVALLLALAGCGGSDEPAHPVGAAVGALDSPQARSSEQRVLDARARAVRERRPRLFLRDLDHADRALMARQRRYYADLVQLPLQAFGYRVLPVQWPDQRLLRSWGSRVAIPEVTQSIQLASYDAQPVQRTVGFVFAFRGGRAVIVSDRSATGAPFLVGSPAPWDLTAIHVRRSGSVLGIFDGTTIATAPTVMAAVRSGIVQLDRALPFAWSDHVVVYSVADPRVLRAFTDVPGGAIEHLGGMTFPVDALPAGHEQVASLRMLLMPASVAAGQPFLGRITRHELSHVAIGARDDGDPTWVSEGIAEYLGARGLPQAQKMIPTGALARAGGEVAGMPSSSDFNDSDQEWHYALSWMAVDYICATYGESRMWQLMSAFHDGGRGTKDIDQDAVLERVLGLDAYELATHAADRIRAIYG